MLTSIATIAAAVTALIGVYYSVAAAIKKNSEKKAVTTLQDIGEALKVPKTDAEREKLQDEINKSINS
jgi:hypothetical protein